MNASKARGACTVPGPPAIMIATPSASATSSGVAPRRAAFWAWDAMQPSHCLTTEMARAISSFVFASSAPSPIVLALDIDPYASKTAGMCARSARVGSWSSVSVSLAFPIWFTPRVGRLTLHPVAATVSPDGALPRDDDPRLDRERRGCRLGRALRAVSIGSTRREATSRLAYGLRQQHVQVLRLLGWPADRCGESGSRRPRLCLPG